MSAWDLRWVLLIIGGLILVILYVLGKRHRERHYHNLLDVEEEPQQQSGVVINPAQERQEPPIEDLGDKLQALDSLVKEEAAVRPPLEPEPPRPRVAESRPRPSNDKEKIIVLHIAAPRPRQIPGTALFEAIGATGLEFDAASRIFQYVVEHFGNKQVVFQVANMVKPGVLDPAQAAHFSTPGLSLFMQLPGPLEGLKAFNIMLECAQGLASQLGAQLLDAQRGALTSQAIDQMREEIQLFSLRRANRGSA